MKRTINLSPVNYWTEQPFLNRMVAAGYSGPDPKQPAIFGSYLVPMDSVGAVFEVLWNGGGSISIGPGGGTVQQETGRATLIWGGGGGSLLVVSRAAGQSNFRVVRQDQRAALEAGQVWRPDYLQDLSGFSTLRMMDMLATNGSTRTDMLLNGNLPVGGVMPLQLLADLSNKAGIRAWINLPHLITDAAFKAALAYCQAHFAIRPVFEYSNETWNFGFAQANWLATRAPSTHKNDNNYAAGYRAGQLARLARGSGCGFVLGGQLVVPTRMTNVFLGVSDAGAASSDFSAIAPATYIAGDIVDYTHFPDLALQMMDRGDPNAIGNYLLAALPMQRALYNAWGALAKVRDMELWAYEGSMFHLNARQAKRDQDKLRQFFQSFQLSPQAVTVLKAYTAAWQAAGSTRDALFNLASASTLDGFFGAKLQPMLWAWMKSDNLVSSAEPGMPHRLGEDTELAQAGGQSTSFS